MSADSISGFELTAREQGEPIELPPGTDGAALLSRISGATFDGGLYRIHTRESSSVIAPAVNLAFPAFQARVSMFGFDWLGRQFGVDSARTREGQPLVLLLEPGTGEALEIPTTLAEFHEAELFEQREAALAESFFKSWQATTKDPVLAHKDCVGYRVPLFLSGADDLSNLEVTDMEVYWHLAAQLIRGTADLPVGTRVDGVQAKREGQP